MRFVQVAVIISALTLISGCGGFRKESVGVDEKTAILIMASDLVGAQISADDRVVTVTKSDLREFKVGVLGVADSEEEKLDTFELNLEQGSHRVDVTLGGRPTVTKQFYLSEGQVRKWVIK